MPIQLLKATGPTLLQSEGFVPCSSSLLPCDLVFAFPKVCTDNFVPLARRDPKEGLPVGLDPPLAFGGGKRYKAHVQRRNPLTSCKSKADKSRARAVVASMKQMNRYTQFSFDCLPYFDIFTSVFGKSSNLTGQMPAPLLQTSSGSLWPILPPTLGKLSKQNKQTKQQIYRHSKVSFGANAQ